jgi:hypothetical protein
MARRNGKASRSSPKTVGEIRLRGKRIATLDESLTMVRTGPSRGAVRPRRADQAGAMLRKAARALTKPGINKLSIFKGRNLSKIFAYSADPHDASKVVQEASDGTRRVGKAVGRKFKRA